MKSRLMSGAMVLAVSSVIAKVLGALYRIPLTNILGAEGMGVYQLVFPIYALFLSLSTSGLPTALSRIVAEKKIKGEETKRLLIATAIMILIYCTAASFIIVVFSKYIAAMQGNHDSRFGYFIIAPSIMFVGGIAVLRGWFQGNFNMVPTAVSNIIEQVVKLVAGLSLAVLFLRFGVKWAVYGTLAGVTLSELVALLYLLINFYAKERGSPKESLNPKKLDFKMLRKVSLPISLVAIMLPLSQFSDSFLIVNMLKYSGISTSVATAQYGLLSGPVASLINLPIVVMLSLAIAIVPNIAAERVSHDLHGILRKSSLSIKMTYLIGIPFALFFLVFARPIFSLLYPNISSDEIKLSVMMLSISSISIIFLSAMQVYSSLLQALDRTIQPLRNITIAVFLKIVASLFMTRYFGILGSAISNVFMAFVCYLLNTVSFRNYLGIDIKLIKNVSSILLASVIMALVGYLIVELAHNSYIALAVGSVVCLIIYAFLVLIANTIDDKETSYLPLGTLILKLKKTLRFWER